MVLKFRAAKRNQHGSLIGLGLLLAFILTVLGALAFDMTSAREQYNQLQSATDAAALAAASWLSDPTNATSATATDQAKSIALSYFQKNSLLSAALSAATGSSDVFADNPAAGNSTLSLVINSQDHSVTVRTSFGLRPTILGGIGTFPLHAVSTAGPGSHPLTGDV